MRVALDGQDSARQRTLHKPLITSISLAPNRCSPSTLFLLPTDAKDRQRIVRPPLPSILPSFATHSLSTCPGNISRPHPQSPLSSSPISHLAQKREAAGYKSTINNPKSTPEAKAVRPLPIASVPRLTPSFPSTLPLTPLLGRGEETQGHSHR